MIIFKNHKLPTRVGPVTELVEVASPGSNTPAIGGGVLGVLGEASSS